MEWVTFDAIWPYFDGWCASRNVDHLELPWDRWLNLVYYFAIRNASEEDKAKFDNAMNQQVTAWNLAKAKPVIEQARIQPKDGKPMRRLPPKPAGWGDDRTNTFNSKAALATLTSPAASGKRRLK